MGRTSSRTPGGHHAEASTSHRSAAPGASVLGGTGSWRWLAPAQLASGRTLVLASVTYYLTAQLSLHFALVERNVTPFWPPTGIALAAFLIVGRRTWPGIALAAFLVNAPISASPWAAILTAGGNTLAPLVAAELLRRVGFRTEIDRLRDAFAIVLLAASAMVISASIGAGTLVLSGQIPARGFLPAWAVWWAGDATGVLFVTPFVFCLLDARKAPEMSWSGRLQAAGLMLAVGLVATAVMSRDLDATFAVLPFLGLAAWRFHLRGAAPSALLVAGIATWAAAQSLGPFAGNSLLVRMLTLQGFNATVAFTSLVFAAVVAERARDASALEDRVRLRTSELAASNLQLGREQESLRRSEERFRALLESAPDPAVIIDEGGRIVLVNDQAERVFGHARKELLGEKVEVLLPERLRTAHTTDRARYFAEPRTRPMGIGLELAGRRSDGTEFPVEISLASLETEQGRLAMAFIRDVTERKRAEENLRQTVDILRATDQKRRQLLTRLVTAQEEERRRIASDIHDDTLQVITAVGIRLDTLARSTEQDEQVERLKAVQQTVQTAIGRLRRLTFELRPPVLDRDGLIPALRAAIEEISGEVDGRVSLVNRLEDEPPPEVRAIAYRVAQEAIANVRKHAQARDVRLVVETKGDGMLVLIEDDGRGFSPADATGSPAGHLGLATMRERVELGGGWLRVRSAPGAGTDVEFWLPVEAPARGA